MKKYLPFLFLLFFNVVTSQDDIATIKQRLTTSYMTNPSKSSVDDILSKMNLDGSFNDIANYSANTDLRSHLTKLNTLASAYKNSSNFYYNNTTIRDKYYLSLNYWITKNPTPSNWWYRQIAYPKEVTKGFVLMADNMKADNLSLYNNAVSYLMWGYNNSINMDGANISDTIIGAFGAAVWESNTTVLNSFRDLTNGLLSITTIGEGIDADYMFGQHSSRNTSNPGIGRQINLTSYGKEFYKTNLSYIEFTNGTAYGVNNFVNLENCVLNAFQWVVFKNRYDPSTSGRTINSNTSMGDLTSIANRMVALNSPQNADLKIAKDRINNVVTAPALVGNSMFWRYDYMVHRNTNYMMSTRMTSIRTVSTESDGVSVGLNNYYSGAGVNYITVTGSEYDGNYFANFNYRQFPGITAEQDAATLPVNTFGSGGTNGNNIAGGVTNGTIGCSGMIWQKRSVTATKSWFCFPNEIVALGAGIEETGGTANVYTTLNQTNFNAVEGVSYSKAGVVTATTTPTSFSVSNPDWFYHGSIGYANLNVADTQPFVVNTNNGIVSMAINHGVNPVKATTKYSYVILPNATLAGMPTLASGLSSKIVVDSNVQGIQAVTHTALNTTQLMFSLIAGGTVTTAVGDKITVDVPCAVIIDRPAGKIYVANPRAESAGTSVNVTYVDGGGVSTTNNVVFPTGNMAGSTVSFTPSNLLAVESFQHDDTKASVIFDKNKLKIAASFPIDKVAVYNMSGSQIHSFTGNGTQAMEETLSASEGIYIVIINNKVSVKVINRK